MAWLNLDGSHVDSFCGGEEFRTPVDAMNLNNYWEGNTSHVHWVIFDLGQSYLINKVRGFSDTGYDPTDVDIYISDNEIWGAPVATGLSAWQDCNVHGDARDWVEEAVTPKIGRYVKVVINKTEDGDPGLIEWGLDPDPYLPIFDVFVAVTKSLAGTITSTSTVTGAIKRTRNIVGTIASTSTAIVTAIKRTRKIAGTIVIGSVFNSEIKRTRNLAGTIVISSTVVGELVKKETVPLAGIIEIHSIVDSAALAIEKELAATVAAVATISADLSVRKRVARTSIIRSVVTGSFVTERVKSLATTIASKSIVHAQIKPVRKLAVTVNIVAVCVVSKLDIVKKLSVTITCASIVIGELHELTGEKPLAVSIEIHSLVSDASLIHIYSEIPPEMHAALIDPYSGGAWLWLVKIEIPGYSTIKLARNPADVRYNGTTYKASNLEIGMAALTGDGSVPRTLVKVAQDAAHTLEDKINATQGASGGRITIIRAHEDFLDSYIAELEEVVDILVGDSDTDYVVFQLGIPDPLLRKIPLRRYSSKICPYALPGLFKGIECQYDGVTYDSCGGKYTDCILRENEVHFGAELGLDPATTQI